jgi:adenylate kinase family enzyme
LKFAAAGKEMRKVLVIGVGGAGKSTFAVQMGKITGLPVVHLDEVYWEPGWVEPSPEKWRAAVRELVAQDSWIIDGNYGGTMDIRLAAADMVIFLDVPPWVALWRVIRRWAAHRGEVRPGMAPGCEERLSWAFLMWILRYRSERRPGILRKLRELPRTTEIVVLRSSREVPAFLSMMVERQTKTEGTP